MRVNAAFLLFVLLLMPSNSMADDPGKRITQAEAVADITQFFSTLQRVHPDLLAKVSVEDYIKLKQQTIDDVAKKLDSEGKIGVRDLAYSLYFAAAFFRDAHTAVWSNGFAWPNESNTVGKRFPPFVLSYDNGRFVIAASNNKSLEGMEILLINGKTTMEFLRPILDLISAETLTWKAHRLTPIQAFWYNFSNLCSSAESLALKLRDKHGEETEQTVETVSFTDFQKLNSDRPANKLEQLRKKGTHVNFLDADRTAYLVYPSFNYSAEEKKKIDGIFEEIKARKSQNLIIDVRGNSGGVSAMGDYIFRYLRKDKLPNTSRTRIKVSSDILSSSYAQFLEQAAGADVAKKYSGYLQRKYAGLEGIVVTEYGEDEAEKAAFGDSGTDEPTSKLSAFFSGRVFLLVDNGTFSSGTMFTATCRDYNVGKIIGYETGGVPISFGDVYPFELNNSHISCSVSWKQFFNAKPRPGDDEHGIIPDIPMNDKLLRPYQKEDDPALAYTLDYIKKTRRKH